MKRLSEIAVAECVAELRTACRRPIDQMALETMLGWLRPQFEDILDHTQGAARWADHGHIMRDNGRRIGGLADFFANHSDVTTVGINELTQAFTMVRAVCRVGADGPVVEPIDSDGPAERFLRTIVKRSVAMR